MPDDKVFKIEEVESTKASKVGGAEEKVSRIESLGDKEQFDTAMSKSPTTPFPTQEVKSTEVPSPMTLAAESQPKIAPIHAPSPKELATQTEAISSRIEGIKQTLETEKPQLKKSVQHLLENKLVHIDDKINIALTEFGLETGGAAAAEAGKSAGRLGEPVKNFLNMLTDAQAKMTSIGSFVMQDGANISPATMLHAQLKISYVAQELEFFSNALNKSLETVKTLMNVQV